MKKWIIILCLCGSGVAILLSIFLPIPLSEAVLPVSTDIMALSSVQTIDSVPPPSSLPSQAEGESKPVNTQNGSHQPEVFGWLELRGKTFEIMDNAEEQTLKKSIGWLYGSAIPPNDGMYILMGHRNLQFRLLKKVSEGDAIAYISPDGSRYEYAVTSIEIIQSDAELQFEAIEGSALVLVTCYPFYYSGHAPQKYVVTATLTSE